jgi:competence protein ComEA
MKRIIALVVTALALLGGNPAGAAPKENREITAVAPERARQRGVVNLNDADEAQLEMLPGVGPTKAKRIIEHRRAHPFRRVDELGKVKGFGRKTLARLRPYLTIAGPTTFTDEDAQRAKQ